MCLVFCSYGCYSSGRLLPGPGSLPSLVAVSSSETGFRTGGRAGPLACLLPPSPSPVARGPSRLTPSAQARMESCDAFPQLLRSSLEPPCSRQTVAPTSSRRPGFCSHHLTPLPPLPGQGPIGIPDYTGELSDTEALSSLVLPPNPVTSKFSIIQIQGHNC